MSEKGQVTVPRAARKRHGLGFGSVLTFFEGASGDLILRPAREKPEQDLLDHLQGLQGLDIPERRHLCPPRV